MGEEIQAVATVCLVEEGWVCKVGVEVKIDVDLDVQHCCMRSGHSTQLL